MTQRVIVALLIGGMWAGVSGAAEQAAAPTATSVAEPAPPVETPPAAPADRAAQVLLDDDLPAGATASGTWAWEAGEKASGARSHGHPATKGMQSHAVTLGTAVLVPRNGEIVTQVWLDPANPPRGIMVKFTLETGQETGVYWEGEEEVFTPGEEEEIWYYGLLPEFGRWTPLAVAAEDLGIEDTKITGVTFVTYDGRVLWDRTEIREAAPLAFGEEESELPPTAP